MEQDQPFAKSTIRHWRYWLIYRWTVIGLWLVQMSLHLPYLIPYRGPEFGSSGYYSTLSRLSSYTGPVSSAPLATGFVSQQVGEVVLFLSVTAGIALAVSLALAFPWAFAVWCIAKIGK